jgi:hypothetical protein
MDRIYAKKAAHTPKRSKRGILAAAVIASLVVVIPVGASVLPTKWHGMDFTIDQDGGLNSRIEAFKELIAGHKNAQDWLEKGIKESASMSAEEVARSFPFTILKPETPVMPLARSVGLKFPTNDSGIHPMDELSYSYWDEYQDGKQWVVVRQTLNVGATAYLNHQSNGHSTGYAEGYQPVQLEGDTIGFVAKQSHHELLMNVIYWNTAKKQAIDLQISGNVPQDLLVQVANSYLAK